MPEEEFDYFLCDLICHNMREVTCKVKEEYFDIHDVLCLNKQRTFVLCMKKREGVIGEILSAILTSLYFFNRECLMVTKII